jgi:hypothetical protein
MDSPYVLAYNASLAWSDLKFILKAINIYVRVYSSTPWVGDRHIVRTLPYNAEKYLF